MIYFMIKDKFYACDAGEFCEVCDAGEACDAGEKEKLQIYISKSLDPYENLARELYLMEDAKPGVMTLYLWQNEKTVVIGRNQNAWRECRTAELAHAGGRLARRLSGGGAVYHDIGNLNFTFLVHEADYSVDRQLRVIEAAAGMLGVPVERSGRNDILADGRKFSGNAFYSHKQRAYHHGTLLVDTNSQEMARFLRPSPAKLKAKGVASVRSRVVNLSELNEKITIKELANAMQESFQKVYSEDFLQSSAESPHALIPLEHLTESYFDSLRLEKLYLRFADENWIYGRKMNFDFSFEKRFDWGEVCIHLKISDGFIIETSVDTDAIEWEISPIFSSTLKGCKFSEDAMISAISSAVERKIFESNFDLEALGMKDRLLQISADICKLIKEQNI